MSSGIDGKWQALNEERQRLRDENRNLSALVEKLQGQVAELEDASPEGLADAIGERDVLRARVIELQREGAQAVVAPNKEEQEAFDLLLAFMERLKAWGLTANHGEVAAAIHVLQGFVLQHMLQRISGEAVQWGKWYDPGAVEE